MSCFIWNVNYFSVSRKLNLRSYGMNREYNFVVGVSVKVHAIRF